MKKIYFLLIVLLPACASNNSLTNIPLTDLKAGNFELEKLPAAKATVIYFLSPECPFCQGYALTLRNISSQFESSQINFIGVVPGKFYSPNEIDLYKIKYQIPFEIYIDQQKEFTHAIGATVTPQVFVLDKNYKTVYKGLIDDWAVSPGQKKQVVTEKYLSDVLNAILGNKKIQITDTKAEGCFIE